MVGKKRLEKIYTAIIFIFLYAPIVVLMIYSFNESKSRGNWGGFTLKWYKDLLQNREIMTSLYYTLLIAGLSSIISTIIGTLAAIGIYDMKSINKKIALNINYLPILNPDIVTGVALMTLFMFVKMELGFLSLLLAHVTFCIPYVILSVLPKLRQLNKHLTEAAMDLGAKPLYAFRKVILPEIMPGIITGALMAFTLSIDDFVISFFTTGNGVSNLSITIYSMARRGINPMINALSTLMFLAVLGLLLIINFRTTKDKKERI
ncbi:spermidine/putrescine transport system permease protein PotC [Gottschalkia acidurici 9a]|uniref:Spermidine/putrescine transport system permease protein PotC n=1 Tax=Gottschalkia acidurici (strain ATCC 7906 / DSM 604 / BCRC 14475 / CIP 104303 / KCTC 5404 / NCIMB 10678 / 9a) TaxID=1128398 RepID=K0AZ53_GOTA9|nr:ABC transporter permease [Gottschalkia acidurici]AFS77970.1 spermidine/putrescine transport system permease protein PotC [Gottschalkia acidurici 9a]